MLNKKLRVKLIKVRLVKDIAHFSAWQFIVFIALFGAIGGYFVFRSLAASGANIVATDGPYYNDSLAVGADGNPRISYTNSNGALMLIHCLDPQCNTKNTSQVDLQGGNNHTSLAIGSDGDARISYVYNHTLKFAQCTNIDCTTSVISTVTTDSANTSLSISSGSMALGSDGNARIIYTTKFAPYGNGLKFVHCTNAACSTSNIANVFYPGGPGAGTPTAASGLIDIPSITPSLSLDNDLASFSFFETDNTQSPDWIDFVHCSDVDCANHSLQHVWSDGGPSSSQISNYQAAPSSTAAPSGTDQFTQYPGTNYFVVLGTGSVKVHFDYVGRIASCNDRLEVFKVDDANGSINGVLPGDVNWPTQVSSRNPQLVFDASTNSPGDSTDLGFQGGDILSFRLTGCYSGTYFYSFPQANSDAKLHMMSYQGSTGQPWQMDWEDQVGTDYDYNDMDINMTGVQGGGDLTPVLEQVSSTIGTDGNPDLAFIWERNLPSDSSVRYIHCKDPQCTSIDGPVTVDTDSVGALDTYHNGIALAVGSDNLARLAFTGNFNGTNSLKFIRCTIGDCSSKVGATEPVGTNTGYYTSLALASAGGVADLPRLAYQDMGTGDLNFAGCGDINCKTIGLPAVTAPTAPSDLRTGSINKNAVKLKWNASTSTVGIAGYNVYEVSPPADTGDGDTSNSQDVLVGTSTTTSFQVTGLQSDTGYGFYVVAKDTEGNVSQPSNTALATTKGAGSASSVCDGVPADQQKDCTRQLSGVSKWPYKSPFGNKGTACKFNSSGQPVVAKRCVGHVLDSVVDEGVDYWGTAPIYAVGNGKIVNFQYTPSEGSSGLGGFGPTWIAYQLTSGPASGNLIYVAEHCTPASGLHVGQSVTANTMLCMMQPASIETGWAISGGGYPAAAYYCYSELKQNGFNHVPTQWGDSFNDFIFTSGGPRGLYIGIVHNVQQPTGVHACADHPIQSQYAGSWYSPHSS